MVKELVNKWVTSQLDDSDIIQVFVEYSKTFGTKEVSPQEVIAMFHVMHTDWQRIINRALHDLAVKYECNVAEIYDKDGKFVARYYNIPPK